LNRVFDGAGIGYVPSVEHTTASRALRIVAKWMVDVPRDVEEAIKIASRHHGATLRELSEENRAFGATYRKSAAFREIVARAAAIEGLPFGFARTKRSVIVAPKPLRASFAFSVDAETGDRFVQSTRDSFPIGDIRRVDVATLQILSVIGERAGESAGDDTSAYELVARGDLDGVYLLEAAPGRLASSFGIHSFDDLLHFVALLRQRRTGVPLAQRVASFRAADVSLPAAKHLGEALFETHRRLLFEDQIGEVVARLTGLAPAEAGDLARRFHDHTPGNLGTLRRDFFALTVEAGVHFEAATEWFGRLLRHALIALDRQRIMADALIVRACLVRKTHARAEFFARLLDSRIDASKRARYQELLEAEGKWLAPSVRDSGRGHVISNDRVRAPLWTIPGVTRDASDAIMRMHASERTGSIDDFRLAAFKFGINFETVDALIRAGAFGIAAEVIAKGSGSPGPVIVSNAASEQMNMTFADTVAAKSSASDPSPAREPSSKKDGNSRHGFRVVPSLSEFYPHPSATPVELAGRIRNLRDFKTSSGKTVGFFELFDSSGSVRVFVPWERVARLGEPLSDGCRVIVTGKVRLRDGRKVCDALEIVLTEGGNGHGETSPDDPSKGDP
jgi:DNA polymerase III alpha subunit